MTSRTQTALGLIAAYLLAAIMVFVLLILIDINAHLVDVVNTLKSGAR